MKKFAKSLTISSLVVALSLFLFNNYSSTYEVKNDFKTEKNGYTYDVSLCVDENTVIGSKNGSDVKLGDLKPVVRYNYGDKQLEVCDNPNLSIKVSIPDCDLEGWYYDKDLTIKVEGGILKDVMGDPAIEVKKQGNCITVYKYITDIYAKCKTTPTCPTDMNEMYKINYVIDNKNYSKVDAKAGDTISTPNPTKEGYTFDGWYLDASFSTKFTGEVTLEKVYDENNCATGYKDVTLYGKWVETTVKCDPVEEEFTVIYNTNGGNKIDSVKVTKANKSEAIPTPVREGYEFKGWYLDANLTQKANYKKLSDISAEKYISDDGCLIGYKNVTLYAGWYNDTPNPETGDNIIMYGILGIILVGCCGIVTKKLLSK